MSKIKADDTFVDRHRYYMIALSDLALTNGNKSFELKRYG